MLILQDFYKIKKQNQMVELKDLNQNDGQIQLQKMTQKAQTKIQNFKEIYQKIDEELMHNTKEIDGMKLVKEAKSELDEIQTIIQDLKQIQLSKITENSQRQQTVAKLILAFEDSKEKLKQITQKLQRKQQASLQSARQSIKDHRESQLNVQLLDEMPYDEQYIERRGQQINEMAQIIYLLNQMMIDGAKMIDDQGLQITVISTNTNSARNRVEGAKNEMIKAEGAQQVGNGRMYK